MLGYEEYTEYLVQRGETHKIVFKIENDPDGLVTGQEAVTCVGKFIGSTRAPIPDDDIPVAFTLSSSFAATDATEPNRWYFTLSAADSYSVVQGVYIVEARIPFANGEVFKPVPVIFNLVNSVSGNGA